MNREQSLTNTSHKECLNSQESTLQVKRNPEEGTPGLTGCTTTPRSVRCEKRNGTHGEKHLCVLIGP